MISFVWEAGIPLPAGTGGTENYTIGHVRELNRRGIEARVVTVGVGVADGRDEFVGIPFHSVARVEDIGELDGTVIFVTQFPEVRTRWPAYQMLHVPPPRNVTERIAVRHQMRARSLIATSAFAARLWADFLDVDIATVAVVYPFAEPCFAEQPRLPADPGQVRILYAGRLSPEKGIYTLLATLHSDLITADRRISITATTAGADKPQGAIIELLLHAHPGVAVVDSCKTPEAMASLMAAHDIVVIPSNSQYWHETFGIVSIEAQHTGCRVVASDDGGLPETDCGGVTLVVPDDPEALAVGLQRAITHGAVTPAERRAAASHFTVASSASALLEVLRRPRPKTPAEVVEELEALVDLPSPRTADLIGDRP